MDVRAWPAGGDLSETYADVEPILRWFFEECSRTTDCLIHESTPEAVEGRFDRIMAQARLNATFIDMQPHGRDWAYPSSPYTRASERVWLLGYIGLNWLGSAANILHAIERSVHEVPATSESEATAGSILSNLFGVSANVNDHSFQDPLDPDAFSLRPDWGESYERCNDIGGFTMTVDEMAADLEAARARHRLPGEELLVNWSCVGKKPPANVFTGEYEDGVDMARIC